MNPENLPKNLNNKLTSCVLWTALVTPFTPAGSVDYDNLTILAKQQADAGNGILILGSTGESLSLAPEEQLAVVEHVVNLNLNVPVMVGVAGFAMKQQLKFIANCNLLNIDAYLLGATLYSKPGEQGQLAWYQTLLYAAEKPCMLYNVPSRSSVDLSVQALVQLQEHPNCWALKEASGDLDTFKTYQQHCPKVVMFSGEDGLMPALSQAGAQGLVSVAANVWPEQTQAYVKQCLTGVHQGLNPIWQQAAASLFSTSNPVPVKALMHQKGMLSHNRLRQPLSPHDLASTEQLEIADQQVQQWFSDHVNSSTPAAS